MKALLALVALVAIAFVTPAFAQSGSIGLYTDTSGSTCSFSGNDIGFIKAYVVVRPGSDGFRSVSFSAPVPACLGAIYIGDEPSFGLVTAGDSQTGIVMTASSCTSGLLHVLTINYYRNGSTTPCCAYPILPSPGESAITGTNCANLDVTLATSVSHFNADATCACTGGYFPNAPSNPAPSDQAGSVSVFTALSWFASDNDNDLLDYDVYLGTDPSPPLAATHVGQATFQPAQLDPLTHYFWRVVARDALGHETTGPVWTFTTRLVNSPPDAPSNPIPDDGFATAAVSTMLKWSGNDIDGDLADYDVYFGTDADPPLVAANVAQTTYQPATLDPLTLYHWRVVARDAPGHETSGPTWSFTTRVVNSPPNPPAVVSPVDGGEVLVDNPTLRWQASDIDGDATTYDLYFGRAAVPPLVASGLTAKNYQVNSLQLGYTYYWKVVVRDAFGLETTGPVWSFSRQQGAHVLIYGPEPKKGGADVPVNATLTWRVENTYPFPLTYDVYFGEFGNPDLVPVATNLVTPSYTRPGGYQAGREYRWFITAHGSGLTAYGPQWGFYTGPSQTNTPSNPSPPYLGTSTSLAPTLSWGVVNPNGHPLTYEVHLGTQSGDFPLPTVATVSQPSYQPGPLQPGLRYYWRITACDESLCSIGPEWTFVAEGPVPVLFTSFNAVVLGDAIRVAWELTTDEDLRQYALLRRQKGTTSWNTIAELPLDSPSGSFLDRGAARGKSYEYTMLVRTQSDEFSSPIVDVEFKGMELTLGRSYPNPFNPQTVIPYDIPANGRVRMAIYDPSGRLVRLLVDEAQEAGKHETSWNGRDDAGRTVSSGVYFCVLETGKERRTQKLVLLK
jgi:hypothetical protein